MKKQIIFSSLIVFVIMPCLVFGAPFVRSHTGLINAPTADVVPHLGLELAGSVITYKGAGIESNKSKIDWDARLTAGLLDRFELGVTALTEKLYTGNFKLKVFDDSGELGISDGTGGATPAVAWGVRDITGRTDITSTGTNNPYNSDQNNSLYVVASKKFNVQGIKFGITLGWGTNSFKADTPLLKKFGGLFGGLNFPMPVNVIKELSLLIEMDGKHVNAGLEYGLPFPGIKVGVAAMSLDRLKTSDATTVGEGEGLSFGGGIIISSKGLGLW